MPTKPRTAKAAILAPADASEPVGPGNETPFTFHPERAGTGDITVASLAKTDPRDTEPFRFALAMAEDNEQIRTAKLVVLMSEIAAGDNWPQVKASLSKLNSAEFQRFNEEWATHSGISVGE